MSSIDLEGVYARFQGKNMEEVQKAYAKIVLDDCNKVIKAQEYPHAGQGKLAASGKMSSDGKTISWQTDYARRDFYQKHSGGHKTRHWFQQARKMYLPRWEAKVKQQITK